MRASVCLEDQHFNVFLLGVNESIRTHLNRLQPAAIAQQDTFVHLLFNVVNQATATTCFSTE